MSVNTPLSPSAIIERIQSGIIPQNGRRALVAMSGGVDSAVTAALMLAQGYRTTGSTIRMRSEHLNMSGERSCCSQKDIDAAAAAAHQLGIEHIVLDQTANFEENVIRRFVESYQSGKTPNPCVACNRYVKFKTYFDRAAALGFDVLATGHYARIRYDGASGRWQLLKGRRGEKDQSYVLYTLTQAELSRLQFPCGEYTKTEIRAIAAGLGLPCADQPDSQDICFIPGGDYHDFLLRYCGNPDESGSFVDAATGAILGPHKGFTAYTIGQRKGLGISAGRPLFVLDKDPVTRAVYLGDNADLFRNSLTAGDLNWIQIPELTGSLRCSARIRYNNRETLCVVTPGPDATARADFDEPVRAVAKGQSVVFYQGDAVVGGGVITG